MTPPDGSPQCVCYFKTWTQQDVGRIAHCVFCMGRQSHHIGVPLQRDLTRVLSILQKSIPRQTYLAPDSIPSHLRRRRTLPKSYLDNLLITIRNIPAAIIELLQGFLKKFSVFVFAKIFTVHRKEGNNYTWKKSSAGKMCVKRSHCPTSLPETMQTCTLIKKKIKFCSYIRKFRVEQLQSHVTNGLLIYGEIFAHFLIYQEALAHI